MDDRQRQIREGAGLAESRLNEEFIEFLQKWSMPLLVAIAVLAVGYTVYGKVQKARDEKVDQAFQELEAATSAANPSPDSLQRVAEEFEGVRAVPMLARLAAADAYLKTIRSGVKPGAQLNPDGTPTNADDALTEKDRDFNLSRAKDLYQQVYDQSSRDEAHKILTINALFGLAAIAESRKELDGAKSYYEKIVALSKDTSFALQAKIAQTRIDSLPELAQDIRLYKISELAPLPEAPKATNVIPASDALHQGGGTLKPDGTVAPTVGAPPDPTKPAEPAPKEPAPTDPKNPDAKPAETKPAETKPAEPKPAEPKPGDPK